MRSQRCRLYAGTVLRGGGTLAFGLAALVSSPASANPQGGQVSAGAATVGGQGSPVVQVNQQSDRAVIDWKSFNIAPGETTRFQQPSASSAILNRIHDQNPSQIMGSLSANGIVALVNPNGMVFGKGSKVDVGSLIATTADIPNERFMQGRWLLFGQPGEADAAVVNRGSIFVREGGLAALVAPQVTNTGVIQAKMGRVALGAGEIFTVDLYGDGLVSLAVGGDVASQLVENSGHIAADGGTVTLTTAAAREVVDSLIVNTGVIEATALGEHHGTITLSAEGSNAVKGNKAADKGKQSGNSTVLVSGVLDASGRKAGERGGKVTVTGDNVALLFGTVIDASGHTGISGTTAGKEKSAKRDGSAGGEVLIGGDYLGSGDTPSAKHLYVDPGVLVLNDALHAGDAGRTIFWSDGNTAFYGNVYARALGGKPVDLSTWQATAGGHAGDGGFVETSGHGHLDAGGYVDLTASNGARGTYFLDPADITIYGNVDPAFQSTDGSINLSTNLKLWLDASDRANVTLTYSGDALGGATASGTSGTNTITTSADVSANLAVGARIRIGGAGAVTAANTQGADTYTITAIAGTTVTTAETLSSTYTGSALYRGLVSQVTDKSGVANHATQATAANMPMWVSNGQNGLGILSLDGSTDYLSLPSLAYGTLISSGQRSAANQSILQLTAGGVNNRGVTLGDSGTTWDIFDVYYLNSALASAGQWVNAQGIVSGTLGFNLLKTQPAWLGYGSPGFAYMNGKLNETIVYNNSISATARNLVEQYQSAKWGIALTPPGTGATEVAKATASDGYSVFTTRYLERLSATADVSLLATNNVTLDLKGDTLNFSTSGRNLTLNAGNQITTASAGTITTNNGAINLTGTNGILFNHAYTLNAGGGNIALNNATTLGANLTLNSGGGIAINGAQTAVAASDTTLTFNGPAAINAPLDLSNATGGTQAITFNDAATVNADIASGGGDIAFNDTLSLGADIATGGGDITLADDVTLTGPGSIDTDTADIDFDGTLDGAFDLTLSTTGDVDFSDDVGTGAALGDLAIAGAADVTFAGELNAASFALTGGTGAVLVTDAADIANDIGIATAGTVTFGDNLVYGGDVAADAGASAMTFNGTVDGPGDFELTTTHDITFADDVGGVTRLGDVIVDPRHVIAGGAFNAASFTLLNGTGNVNFSAGTGLNATGAIGIDTNGTITGTYAGTDGVLDAGAGTITATVSFTTLDIAGAEATLGAGYIGAPGTADQRMANLISIGGVTSPPPASAYTFAGWYIGGSSSSGGDPTPAPAETPPVTDPGPPPAPVTPPAATPGDDSAPPAPTFPGETLHETSRIQRPAESMASKRPAGNMDERWDPDYRPKPLYSLSPTLLKELECDSSTNASCGALQ